MALTNQTQTPSIVETIVQQLEAESAPRIPDDDPIRTFIRAHELVMEAALKKNMDVAKEGMRVALSGSLTEELSRATQAAVKAIRAARLEADQSMVSLCLRMERQVEVIERERPKHYRLQIMSGILIAALILAFGILIGPSVMMARWHP